MPVNINNDFATIDYADFVNIEKGCKAIAKLLTVVSIDYNKHVIKTPQFIQCDSCIKVPRMIMQIISENHTKYYLQPNIEWYNNIDYDDMQQNAIIRLEWGNINMTSIQEIAIESINECYNKYFDLGLTGALLDMPPGLGKSYVATRKIYELQAQRTLVIVHSSSMIEQWKNVIQTCIPNITIGEYHSKRKVMGDVMIVVVKSANGDEFKFGKDVYTPDAFFKMFKFVILDECHLYGTATYRLMFRNGLCGIPYILALSGTPDSRNDGLDKIVIWHCGQIIRVSDSEEYNVNDAENLFSATIHKISYSGHPDYIKSVKSVTGDTSAIETIKLIAQDEARNKMIVDFIKQGVAMGLYLIVFSELRTHLDTLQNMYNTDTSNAYIASDNNAYIASVIVDDEESIKLVGGDADKLMYAEKNCRVIFTTYPFMGTGKSIDRLTGAILATPRKNNIKQFANRIFRLGNDPNIRRHIWDIVDVKITLKSQWTERNAYWKSRSTFEVVNVKKKYDEYVPKVDTIKKIRKPRIVKITED